MTSIQQIKEIDSLIENQYSNSRYGELVALSKLFTNTFLTELEKIINVNSRVNKGYKERFEISCGWIDKIPLAQLINPTNDINGNLIKNKIELGDLLLIYTHNRKNISSKGIEFISSENRATIIQAKIAYEASPKVPIGKISNRSANSTSKELALLSSWPEFDLYKTSRCKYPLLKNIKLDNSKPNAKFAGYYSKHWYVGKPINNDICSESLGSLIIGMISGKEGQEFDTTKKGSWDILIAEIVKLCGKYQLPNFIFGANGKTRYQNIKYDPLILFFFFGKEVYTIRKFPVLVINKIVEEG